MLTNMIKEEVEKMEQRAREAKYEKREKKKKETDKEKPIFRNSESTKRSSYLLKKAKNYSQYYGYKPQDTSLLMSNLNLAKIKNQISAKECDKKVQKFLEEPLWVD